MQIGAVMASIIYLLERIWPTQAKAKRTALLKKLLGDERFPQGRSFEELQRKVGMTETPQACRDLLSEIGAKGIKLRDGREGWRLSVLMFAIFCAGCLVSHLGTAIAQNPGDTMILLKRPQPGGEALFFSTQKEKSVSIYTGRKKA